VDSIKWLVGKYAPRTYGDKPLSDEAPKEITFRWEANDSQPPPIAAPPKQLPYHKPEMPADLSPEDWSLLMQILELLKRVLPSGSDMLPAEVLDVARKALLEFCRETA
jgi:hypothetical protein